MPISRPNADIAVGQWFAEDGSTTGLYAHLDGTAGRYLQSREGAPLITPSTVLPNEYAPAEDYSTLNGTGCRIRHVYVGTNNDLYIAMLVTPNALDNRVATPHVCWHHGAQADEENGIFGNGFDPHTGTMLVLDSLLDLGYGVISLREGSAAGGSVGSDLWANHACRVAMSAVTAWYESMFRQHHRGMLYYCVSMGGPMGFNHALQRAIDGGPPTIAAIAIIDGAMNLQYVYDIRNSLYHPAAGPLSNAFASAYGLTPNPLNSSSTPTANAWVPDAQWAAKVQTVDEADHDPMTCDLSLLPLRTDGSKIPFLVSHSSGDGTIDENYNGKLFITRLSNAGFSVTGIQTTGQHVAISHFDPTSVNAFYAAALA